LETVEQLARSLQSGWEAELRLVVDAAFPRAQLLDIVAELQRTCPNTQMQLSDAVLSGAEEAITQNQADVVVTSRVPTGHLGDPLLDVDFVAVARPAHPLFVLERELSAEDLMRHVQAVVRDSGSAHRRDDGWLGAEHRFTVSSMEASLSMLLAGLAFAWLPEHLVRESLAAGTLKRLPLVSGGTRTVALNIVLVRPDVVGPAARAAVDSFKRHAVGKTMRSESRSVPTVSGDRS
jgi:DNA-binding transcriptional LysR family regulator